jgi:hypothetical protein
MSDTAAVVEARRRGWGHATTAPDAEVRRAQVVNALSIHLPTEPVERLPRVG